jgi:hypothetical protein
MKGEILVPIVLFLVVGVISVSFIFFKSKEKQMLIEKNLTPEQIKDFFKTKRDPNILMKLGIIIFFFGLGLGSGLWCESMNFNGKGYDNEFWIPFLLFTFTGIGFIIANLIDRFLKKNEN